MRLWIGVVLLGSLSCDKVIGLTQHFDAPPISEKDADLRPDAVDCMNYPGGQPDEDADGRNDFCDNCPTVSNVTQVDGDGDGVGFECDPAPNNAGDRIAFFASMLTLDGLELDPTVILGMGAATINTGKVKVAARVKPTFVVAEVSLQSFSSGDKLTMEVAEGANEWACDIGFGLAECGGDDCIGVRAPLAQPQAITFDAPEMTARVMIETRGNGFTQCSGYRVGGMRTQNQTQSTPIVAPDQWLQADGFVAVKMLGKAEVRNVIVYDRP